jgi:hypothetical protein
MFPLEVGLFSFFPFFSSIPNFRTFAKRQAFFWSSGVFPERYLVLFRCSFGVPF